MPWLPPLMVEGFYFLVGPVVKESMKIEYWSCVLRPIHGIFWILLYKTEDLTEVAGEGGPNLAPQKFLLSQKFRYLMRCKKYLENFFLSCLVSEIQLFVYIFGWISKWPTEVRKGWLVKFFEVSYYQKNFQPPTVHNSEDRRGVKMPYDFFVYICDFQ